MDSVATGVQVLDRVVAIVDAVAAARGCTLADLVVATGLSRPTAHRLAVALTEHRVLARDDAGRFVLGSKAGAWAADAGHALVAPARAVLAALSDSTGESAQLYVREGDRRVCIAVHERPSGLRDTVPLGAVMSLELGSGAKILLAEASDAERFAVNTAELAAVRRRGWAESVAEREPGVASVSAPVRGADGAVIAAIGVSGPVERLGERPGRRLARAVVAAADTLSRAVMAG